MPTMTDEEIAKLAKQRVGFRMNLAAYVLVNLFLVGVWFVTSGGHAPTLFDNGESYFWPIWPILGWGLGLAFHWYSAFGPGAGMQAREEARIRESLGGR
jgi:hypothetical protein